MKDMIRERWRSGRFHETGQSASFAPTDALPWVEYESYMRAQLFRATPGKLGVLHVAFPPEGTEDNELHVHPVSDRVITVISGSGVFVARRPGGAILELPLATGDRVWMPRGILHTFKASAEGLLVESLHNPWVPLEDPRCLVYPKRRMT